tara:strand:- start:407 stop:568 length:162 start_codon:yes stop_codon:yes gene_type:complete
VKKSPNFSIEAVFKQVDIKTMAVQINLFKLVNVDMDTVVFHEHDQVLFSYAFR